MMLWLLLAVQARAEAVSVLNDALGAHLVAINTAVNGKLVVGGNWDTYKPLKKAVAASGVEIRTEKVGDTEGQARADIEKILDKDNLKCGLVVRLETKEKFSVLELGTCKAAPPPTPEPAAETPAPAAEPAPAAPAPAPAPTP